MRKHTKKVTQAAIILVLSLLAFMLENLLPPIFPFAPFVKLGFSNIFILLAIFLLDKKFVYLILILKCLLSGIFSSFFSIYYSLPSGLLSMTFSIIMIEFVFPKISLPTISAIASTIFNCTQLTLAIIVTQSTALAVYYPITIILGFFTGALVGFLVWLIGRQSNLGKL